MTPGPPQPVRSFHADALEVRVYNSLPDLARAAAHAAHAFLCEILTRQPQAAVILACAASQVRFLDEWVGLPGLDWSRLVLFHMDEYLGIEPTHAASFRRFIQDRVLAKVTPRVFHPIRGEADEPLLECNRYSNLLRTQRIDLCCLGIGENGHIAFNDPPVADFNDPLKIKLVKLDRACRLQQVGEGAFPNLEAVPRFAYTLTIPALCDAARMICVVPEQRKAQAVRTALQGPISTACPASILRRQSHAVLYLDADSASQL